MNDTFWLLTGIIFLPTAGALGLALFVLLVFVVTLVRLGGNVAERPF